jgi:hypothetical protein
MPKGIYPHPPRLYMRTMGVRIQCDEVRYIKAKAIAEGRSVASVIRDYVTWGIEQDKENKSDNPHQPNVLR